jgi:hypothetical protein
MAEVRKHGRVAIAEFLHAMGRQRAHWYAILTPTDACKLDNQHSLAFPSLSKLTSVDEEILRVLFHHCGLVQYRRNSGYSILDIAWSELIREFYLDEVEVSHLFINKKRRIYIRLGSWQNSVKKTPQEVWKGVKKNEFYAPKLRVTCLSNEFAKSIGALGIIFPADVIRKESENSLTNDSDGNSTDSTASEEGDRDSDEEAEK